MSAGPYNILRSSLIALNCILLSAIQFSSIAGASTKPIAVIPKRPSSSITHFTTFLFSIFQSYLYLTRFHHSIVFNRFSFRGRPNVGGFLFSLFSISLQPLSALLVDLPHHPLRHMHGALVVLVYLARMKMQMD